ncbi:MAG: iron-sulfur cluster assembly accessory protein [Gammaproteobacteria bacterium]|nr:iron-sulfur cluster assembly accessory protein [Gammaproteobacteria bacterium]
MSVTLTANAARHVQGILARQGASGPMMRVAVKPTGCSGFKYVVEPAAEVRGHDHVFESEGIRIVVDDQSLKYLDGTEIDFTREGLNAGLKFVNPNVKETCGCGESFSL